MEPLPCGHPRFERKHGFVGPGAGLLERLVGFGIHEDIVEHVVVHLARGGAVAHVEAGAQVHPFAIIFGELELAVAGVLRSVGGRRGRGLVEGQQRNESYSDEQCEFG